jgi:hypothetical protein
VILHSHECVQYELQSKTRAPTGAGEQARKVGRASDELHHLRPSAPRLYSIPPQYQTCAYNFVKKQLKRSLASHLVAGNVNLALVRQALGPRSIRSAMAHRGTTDAQAAEAAQAALMNLF